MSALTDEQIDELAFHMGMHGDFYARNARLWCIAFARAVLAASPPHTAAPPTEFDRTTALLLLSAASKTGNEGAIRLAAQLAGAAPCDVCGYVNFHCRCPDTAAQAVPAEPTGAFRERIAGAVARGWCHPDNARKVTDPALAFAIIDEVMAALAAPVQAALTEPPKESNWGSDWVDDGV